LLFEGDVFKIRMMPVEETRHANKANGQHGIDLVPQL
jgi:hypothetical protein